MSPRAYRNGRRLQRLPKAFAHHQIKGLPVPAAPTSRLIPAARQQKPGLPFNASRHSPSPAWPPAGWGTLAPASRTARTAQTAAGVGDTHTGVDRTT